MDGEWTGGGGWLDAYSRQQRTKSAAKVDKTAKAAKDKAPQPSQHSSASALLKWIQTPQAVKIAKVAEQKAWKTFLAKYPNADKSKFEPQTDFTKDHRGTSEIYFKAGPGHLIDVFGSDSKYWSSEMKSALGVDQSSEGFPQQLTPSGLKGDSLPIPAVPFHGNYPGNSLKKIFNDQQNIYVTPDQYFTTKFREIFQKTKLTHRSGKESKTWLAGPNMKYWPQQLNFAVWCATTGCGISRKLFEDSSAMPPNVRAFYKFHIYFTVRRILFQMGGIQSISALPGDPTFNQFNNKYDVASYKRICAEFGVDPSSDFRYTSGANHGLGSVYIYITNIGPDKTSASYPGFNKFSDEGGSASKGNLIYYVEPENDAIRQSDFFCPNVAEGLTQAGLARINQSIGAFVYCVLGSQVNVRSSILGSGGRAKEAQSEFLVLVEDAIRQPDLAKSVQRYQLAVDEAKVRLNFAVCPGAWLMPASMVINTESTIGYNNQLKQAVPGMKLGVNDKVNKSTKKVGVTHIKGGPPKIDRPTNHPSNKPPVVPSQPAVHATKVTAKPTAHETNKVYLIMGATLFAFITAHYAF